MLHLRYGHHSLVIQAQEFTADAIFAAKRNLPTNNLSVHGLTLNICCAFSNFSFIFCINACQSLSTRGAHPTIERSMRFLTTSSFWSFWRWKAHGLFWFNSASRQGRNKSSQTPTLVSEPNVKAEVDKKNICMYILMPVQFWSELDMQPLKQSHNSTYPALFRRIAKQVSMPLVYDP